MDKHQLRLFSLLSIPVLIMVLLGVTASLAHTIAAPHTPHKVVHAPHLAVPANVQSLPASMLIYSTSGGCGNHGVAVYEDAGFNADYPAGIACFPTGDYDLDHYCMHGTYDAKGVLTYCERTWADQISSYSNIGGSHSGYFVSDDPNCNFGNYVYNFYPRWSNPWIGFDCNDSFFYLHVGA